MRPQLLIYQLYHAQSYVSINTAVICMVCIKANRQKKRGAKRRNGRFAPHPISQPNLVAQARAQVALQLLHNALPLLLHIFVGQRFVGRLEGQVISQAFLARANLLTFVNVE